MDSGTPVTHGELRGALAAGDHSTVLTLLGDLTFLEERCRDSIDALFDDLAFVLRRAPTPLPAEASLEHPSGARLDRDVFARVEAVLDGSRNELSRDPAAKLFPLLYNELYWHDAPERGTHHDGLATPIRGHQLWRWMESWRATVEARPGAAWLRNLRPPVVPRASLTSWRVAASVRSISPDATRLLARGDALVLLDARTGNVRATLSNAADAGGRFARDGNRFVVRAATSVQLWSGEPPVPGATFGPQAHDIEDVVFSCSGDELITQARNELRVFRFADGTCVATRKLRRRVSRILACAGGVVVHDGTSWRHWDYARDQMGRTRMDGYAEYTAVSPSGDRMLSGAHDGRLGCWSLPDTTSMFVLPGSSSPIAFHPSGDSFAMRDHYSRVIFRDATSGAERGRFHRSNTASMTYDPTGRYLVLEHSWGPSALWDIAASRVAAYIHQQSRAGSRVVFSGDGKVLAMGARESTTIVDMTSLAPLVPWRDDALPVDEYSQGDFSPTGETLVVRHERHLSFWDVARGVIRCQVEACAVTVFDHGASILARRGPVLVALAIENGAELWRTALLAGDRESVIAVDAARLLLHSEERIIVLGMDDGKERYRIEGETIRVCQGEWLVTRTSTGDVMLRALDSGVAVVRLPALGGDSYALSPDRRWLAVQRNDLEIWDLTTGTRAVALQVSGSPSFSFRSDSAALRTWRWQTQQSGNQDLLEEVMFDVPSGAVLDRSTTWENDLKSDPSEVATGVVLDEQALRVDGVCLALPGHPIVARTRSGAVRVATVRVGRVELYELRRAK